MLDRSIDRISLAIIVLNCVCLGVVDFTFATAGTGDFGDDRFPSLEETNINLNFFKKN